jgi:hypothetical protein
MTDHVGALFSKYLAKNALIADVRVAKARPGVDIFTLAGVQIVYDDYTVARGNIGVHNMRANEAGSTCYENGSACQIVLP